MKTELQAVRKRAGYPSARAFAERLGLSPNTYTAYEQGRIAPPAERLCEMADALGCTVDEILGRRAAPAPRADPRQAALLEDFAALSDAGKDAAVGSVRGILASEKKRARRGEAPLR